MAHELTIRADGRAEMAFVGETPWHGLGQSVTKGASIGVWQREAGMDWLAKEAAALYRCDLDAPGSLRTDETYKHLYRSDNGAPLSVVGQRYQVVQPKEVLEFFRDLTEGGGWHIHTAGTLRGGRKLWAMASNDSMANVGRGDQIRGNLLLGTSLDGSMKTTAMITAVRVVCANTLALALSSGGKEVTVSHRSVFDADAIKRSLGVAEESFSKFMRQAKEMAETPINTDAARDVLRLLFGKPNAKAKVDLSWLGSLSALAKDSVTEPEEEDYKEVRTVTRCLELFEGEGMGASLKTAAGTRWGLLNAVTQHVDHEMGRSDDTRIDSAWFGRGAQFKKQAFDMLVAV